MNATPRFDPIPLSPFMHPVRLGWDFVGPDAPRRGRFDPRWWGRICAGSYIHHVDLGDFLAATVGVPADIDVVQQMTGCAARKVSFNAHRRWRAGAAVQWGRAWPVSAVAWALVLFARLGWSLPVASIVAKARGFIPRGPMLELADFRLFDWRPEDEGRAHAFIWPADAKARRLPNGSEAVARTLPDGRRLLAFRGFDGPVLVVGPNSPVMMGRMLHKLGARDARLVRPGALRRLMDDAPPVGGQP